MCVDFRCTTVSVICLVYSSASVHSHKTSGNTRKICLYFRCFDCVISFMYIFLHHYILTELPETQDRFVQVCVCGGGGVGVCVLYVSYLYSSASLHS